MSETINPETQLQVTLAARQWNSLLSCAGEGLNALSALIADVQRQCMRQATPPDEGESLPEHMPMRVGVAAYRPNGEAP